jgi:hypothetical protein
LTFDKCHIGHYTSRQYQFDGKEITRYGGSGKDVLTTEKSYLMFQDIVKTFQANYPYKIPWRDNNLSRDQENAQKHTLFWAR